MHKLQIVGLDWLELNGMLSTINVLTTERNSLSGLISIVPFALRLLHAQLPYALGKPKVTVDLLYKLLDYCFKMGRESKKVMDCVNCVSFSIASYTANVIWIILP